MGKTIETIAKDRGHTISGIITRTNQKDLNSVNADVAIEFSNPESAFENSKKCIERGIPVVCGTTGWLDKQPEIEKLTATCNGTFFYASNFSVGVNIFFKVNEFLAKLMRDQTNYSLAIDEIHHTEKKDAPSGTAITLAKGIMKNQPEKRLWVNRLTDNPQEIGISSFRIAQVPGTHTVKYDSPIDTIEIRHIAHSREGFARGAVLVAEWIKDKKGVLNMNDFLKF